MYSIIIAGCDFLRCSYLQYITAFYSHLTVYYEGIHISNEKGRKTYNNKTVTTIIDQS